MVRANDNQIRLFSSKKAIISAPGFLSLAELLLLDHLLLKLQDFLRRLIQFLIEKNVEVAFGVV